ncbi:MAG: S41 family peptidase [Bacteroidales bacterium]|nr:S41 family peptidase [Bacteroidales bacterium]
MEEEKIKKIRRRNYIPFYVSVAMAIGLLMGMFLIPKQTKMKINYLTNGKIGEVVDLVRKYYFEEIDAEKVNDDAIQSFLASLDPHSSYITRENSQRYDEMLFGQFNGIGIQFNMLNDTLLIVNVVPDGPSHKIGLLAGDKILKVDGENIAGVKIKNEEIISKLRGKKGSKVKVSILRSGIDKLLEYEIVRDKIPLESISVFYMLDKETAYMLVDNFTITTGQEFMRALQTLKKQNMKNLILDLRGNPGGFLGAAIEICDQFLSKNKLIVYTDGKYVGKEEYRARTRGIFEKEEQKIVVLIDEWSASASEIVAGAIQDHDRGVVIGRRSFGKGLVQRQYYLSDSSEVMLTVARYFTPSGRCIQKPFDNISLENYYIDILNRYDRGEMDNADSVKFIDTLKYKTAGGRTVYGGGGIMPDIFIPVEKSNKVVYFNKIANQGILFNFAMEYVDQHRKQLSRFKTVEEFDSHFVITENILQQIIQKAEKQGIASNEINPYAKKLIQKWTKAYIARNLYNAVGFYQIINQEDSMIKKSLEVFKEKSHKK